MTERLDCRKVAPEIDQIMLDFWKIVEDLGLDGKLYRPEERAALAWTKPVTRPGRRRSGNLRSLRRR